MGAAIVEEHARPGHDHAAAEGIEEALAQADRHPVGVDDAEVDRVAAERDGVKRPHEATVELGVAGAEPVERLEPPERLDHQMAAAVGRHLAHVVAHELRAERLHPLDRMRREVGGPKRRRRGDRDRPGVEVLERRERPRELRLHERPVGQEDPRCLGVVTQHVGVPRRHAREPWAPLDAGAREPDRGRGQLGERPGAEALGERAPAGGRARSRPVELIPTSVPSRHTIAMRSPPTPHMCG